MALGEGQWSSGSLEILLTKGVTRAVRAIIHQAPTVCQAPRDVLPLRDVGAPFGHGHAGGLPTGRLGPLIGGRWSPAASVPIPVPALTGCLVSPKLLHLPRCPTWSSGKRDGRHRVGITERPGVPLTSVPVSRRHCHRWGPQAWIAWEVSRVSPELSLNGERCPRIQGQR